MSKALLIALVLPFVGLSQDQIAKLQVRVMTKSRSGIANDKITFIRQSDDKEFSGITNKMGQFYIELPPGDDYAIKLDVIGEELDYQTFNIPEPPPGATFNTVELDIIYDLPESVVLDGVNFASGSSTLTSKSSAKLDDVADYLKRKKIKVRIEGHTDSDGTPEANLKLSEKRAAAVKNYLVKKGVSADLLTAVGKGDTSPVADNETSEGKAQNRRTEIHPL